MKKKLFNVKIKMPSMETNALNIWNLQFDSTRAHRNLSHHLIWTPWPRIESVMQLRWWIQSYEIIGHNIRSVQRIIARLGRGVGVRNITHPRWIFQGGGARNITLISQNVCSYLFLSFSLFPLYLSLYYVWN